MIRIATIILLIINGLFAIFGGCTLLIDPAGSKLDLTTESLKYSPFSDYLIPGLILFIILGLGSAITSIIVGLKVKGYPFLTIFMGFALSIWISVQMLMLREMNGLQIVFGLIGIILIILGISLRRKEYGIKN
jgi:hypothetical protein